MLSALFLASFVALSAGDEAVDLPEIGVRLPKSIGDIRFVRKVEFDEKSLGYGVSYSSKMCAITLYVYTHGKKAIPDGKDNPLVLDQLKRTISDLQTMQDRKLVKNVTPMTGRLPLPGIVLDSFATAGYRFDIDGGSCNSYMLLLCRKNQFLKVRLTQYVVNNATNDKEIDAFLTELARAVGAPIGALTRIAGGGTATGDSSALNVKLTQPFGIDFDKAGNYYLVELLGGRVLKVDPKRHLTVVAGSAKKGDAGDSGPARDATFNAMHSLAVTPDGIIYVADTLNNRVRKLDPKTGTIEAFAGTGKKAYSGDGGAAAKADFSGVYCIALNPDGSRLVVTDLDNRRIRAIDMKTGIVTLVAGNGKKGVPADGADARTQPLVDPRAACFDRKGNIYILERGGHALRVVDAKGRIRTVVGTGKPGNTGDGGPGLKATLNGPKHLCVDLDDNVIIADTANHVIRKYTPVDGKIIRIAGTGKKGESGDGGSPDSTAFNEPHGVFVHPDGRLYIVDSMNHRVFSLGGKVAGRP